MPLEHQASHKTFWEHFSELRRYLFICLTSIVGCALVAHYYHVKIIKILLAPLGGKQLVFLSVIDPVLFVFKTDLLVGLLVSLPLISWCAYKFVSPVFSREWLSRILLVLLVSVILMLGAICYGYFVILPLTLKFLFSVQVSGIQSYVTAQSYINLLFLQLLLLVGIFQIPLAMVGLTYIGFLNPYAVAKKRGWVYLGLTVMVGFFVPPDFLSILIMLVPSLCVFEVSVILCKVIYNRNLKKRNG